MGESYTTPSVEESTSDPPIRVTAEGDSSIPTTPAATSTAVSYSYCGEDDDADEKEKDEKDEDEKNEKSETTNTTRKKTSSSSSISSTTAIHTATRSATPPASITAPTSPAHAAGDAADDASSTHGFRARVHRHRSLRSTACEDVDPENEKGGPFLAHTCSADEVARKLDVNLQYVPPFPPPHGSDFFECSTLLLTRFYC